MAPTTVRHIATTVKDTATQKVWPILEDLVRIAGAANLPVCGGVFAALTYLIDSFDEVQDTKDAYTQLKATLESYTKTLNDFVSVLPIADLSHSNRRDAVIAREAIKTFDGDLQRVLALAQLQKTHNKRGPLLRCVYRKKILGDIEACAKQLEQSHRSFRDAVSNVLVGKVSCPCSRTTPYDEWGITGAKVLQPDAIRRMRSLPSLGERSQRHDYVEFVEAEVGGVDCVVKLFRGERGERAFVNTLKFLQKVSGPHLHIYGHSVGARPPFIVIHLGALVRFDDFIWQSLSDIQAHHEHMIQVWKCVIEIKEAIGFIFTCSPLLNGYKCVQEIWGGVMVDVSAQSITIDVPDTAMFQHCDTVEPDPPDVLSALLQEELRWRLGLSLEGLRTCYQIERALWSQPDHILTRKAFEDARLNPYRAIRSLRPLSVDTERVAGPNWVTDTWHPQVTNIVLVDRSRAAETKQHEYRVVGVMQNEITAQWEVRPSCGMEMIQISSGVYRFTLAPSNGEWSFRIWIRGEVSLTDDNKRLFARKARRLASEYGALVEDIYLVTRTSKLVTFDEIPPTFMSQLSRTIFYYLHLDDYPVRHYWTFADSPLSSEQMMAEKQMIDSVAIPKTQLRWEYWMRWFHVDEWDVKEYEGEQHNNEALSDDMVIVPGGWDSDW